MGNTSAILLDHEDHEAAIRGRLYQCDHPDREVTKRPSMAALSIRAGYFFAGAAAAGALIGVNSGGL